MKLRGKFRVDSLRYHSDTGKTLFLSVNIESSIIRLKIGTFPISKFDFRNIDRRLSGLGGALCAANNMGLQRSNTQFFVEVKEGSLLQPPDGSARKFSKQNTTSGAEDRAQV